MVKPESKVPEVIPEHRESPSATAVENAHKANEVVGHSIAFAMISPEERHLRISIAAYRRAETRSFEPDGELEDWLAAEREVDDELND